MAHPLLFTLHWGILATGGIAQTFTRDLLTNPATRSTHDVTHKVVAVASSSSAARARDFVNKVKIPGDVQAYGSYAELVADPNVQAVYVATPHSHHFQNVMLALEAGKHVLCEKSLTVTAEQARRLAQAAREKKLFLMEAVWTRFLPATVKVAQLCRDGAIGKIHRVIADCSYNAELQDGKLSFDDVHRALNPELAGGALLDVGVYALTWIFLILYHLQPTVPGGERKWPIVSSAVNLYTPTGVDESAAIILHFATEGAMGIATTGLRTETSIDDKSGNTGSPAVRIQGSRGEIQVASPAFKPETVRVLYADGSAGEHFSFPTPRDPGSGGVEEAWGQGMFWQADECARCIRDGKLESDNLTLGESIAVMGVLENVLAQGGVRYPETITSDVYDPSGPLNKPQV
ncbi:NADP:D-xylose dehydrogenase [Xylariales sp. PMI_506]|nr:NADP:D-xylose dehydrogenase [Xylariales sp. PMI_506]